MASWGPKLYQDDLAQDIKDKYKDLLKRGKTSEQILEQFIEEFGNEIEDSDEAPIFWFALADTQWELGRLLPVVKKKAIEWIEKGVDQEKWRLENPREAKIRDAVLKKLKEKLNSPLPEEKKIAKHKIYKCEWKIGDVYAYKLESDYAKENGFSERYLLIHKVDECIWHPGHIIPIVRIKITENDILPNNEKEFEELEYIQTSVTRFEDRFLPFNAHESYESQVERKSKIKYVVDENGLLKKYLLKMLSTSRGVIPQKLRFIGNYVNISPPEMEFIPHEKISILACKWSDIEKTIIEKYLYYNLKK
jgi:hypothetical protein